MSAGQEARIIQELGENDDEDAPKKGVHNMPFMKAARKRQQDERDRLLEEFEGGFDSDDDNAGTEANGALQGVRQRFDGQAKKAKPQADEEEAIGGSENDEDAVLRRRVEKENKLSRRGKSELLPTQEAITAASEGQPPKSSGPGKRALLRPSNQADEEENPWLEPAKATRGVETEKAVSAVAAAIKGGSGDDKGKKRRKVEQSKEITGAHHPTTDINEVLEVNLQPKNDEKKKENKKLFREAFAGAGVEEEDFAAQKHRLIEQDLPTAEDIGAKVLPGWGAWTGKGAKLSRGGKKFAAEARAKLVKARLEAHSKRKDSRKGLEHVILNEKRIRGQVDLTVPDVPFPFQSREQYDAVMSAPLGKEWTTHSHHKYAFFILAFCRSALTLGIFYLSQESNPTKDDNSTWCNDSSNQRFEDCEATSEKATRVGGIIKSCGVTIVLQPTETQDGSYRLETIQFFRRDRVEFFSLNARRNQPALFFCRQKLDPHIFVDDPGVTFSRPSFELLYDSSASKPSFGCASNGEEELPYQ